MKLIFHLSLSTLLCIFSFNVLGQHTFNISGNVNNEKDEPVEGATVFISGSKQITPTGKDGGFKFSAVPTSSVKLVVKMLGYAPVTRNLSVSNSITDIRIQLQPKAINLKEVAIGDDRNWYKNLEIFKEKFLGRSANARACVILNPKIINFSTRKGLLMADADDFLIIENKRLGYRIHYLLQQFEHDLGNNVSNYNGEFSFEELGGSPGHQQSWAKNRADAYKGSFMHFLRAVYNNNIINEGFVARTMLRYGTIGNDGITEDRYKLVVIDTALDLNLTTTTIDSNFRSVFFDKLYIMHDPKKAAYYKTKTLGRTIVKQQTTIVRDLDASMLTLNTCEAVIDRRGSYADHHSFLIKGYWGQNRMGDELPVEYEPPIVRGKGNVRIE